MLSRYITAPLAVLALVIAASVSATAVDNSRRQAHRDPPQREKGDSGGWPTQNRSFRYIPMGKDLWYHSWTYNGYDGVRAMFATDEQKLHLVAGKFSPASTSVAFTIISDLPHSSDTWTYIVKHGEECMVNVPKSPPSHAKYQVRMKV